MDRAPKSLQETLALLNKLYDMPKPRIAKCRTLYELASQIDEGVVVELGTFRGTGAITLCCATHLPVYTVDEYVDRRGWAGEPYGDDDRVIFWKNVRRADVNPILVRHSFEYAGKVFKERIGLLFWDAGTENTVLTTMAIWGPYILRGGLVALHDTSDGRLGVAEVVRRWCASGEYKDLGIMPGGVHVIRRIA